MVGDFERTNQLHEEEHTGDNQQAPNIYPYECPNTVEIVDTEISPARTRAALQVVSSREQIERRDVVASGALWCGRTNQRK